MTVISNPDLTHQQRKIRDSVSNNPSIRRRMLGLYRGEPPNEYGAYFEEAQRRERASRQVKGEEYLCPSP